MYLFYEIENETKARVSVIYTITPAEELLAQHHVVKESIPDPENIVGKVPIPYVNPITGDFWYEYIDKPTLPGQVDQQRLALIEDILVGILGGAL